LECFTSLLNYFRCCTTFIDIISLASAECFSSLSLFTRFYPPVGKALLLWLMDYAHNLKIYRQPDTLERSSYYIGVRTISNAITRSHLARSYSKIGQKHLLNYSKFPLSNHSFENQTLSGIGPAFLKQLCN